MVDKSLPSIPPTRRVNAIEKAATSVDVSGFASFSGAYRALMEALRVRSEVKPANASSGGFARLHANKAAEPVGGRTPGAGYSFATKDREGNDIGDSDRLREYRRARKRLRLATESYRRRLLQEETEEKRVVPLQKWRQAGASFAVPMRENDREGTAEVRIEMWTTAPRSAATHGRRRQHHGGQRRLPRVFQISKRPKPADKSVDEDEATLLFRTTWKFLEETEREFAACFYLQSWWRRRKRLPTRRTAASLLDALAALETATPTLDKSRRRECFALPAAEEAEVRALFEVTAEPSPTPRSVVDDELRPDLKRAVEAFLVACGDDGGHVEPRTGATYRPDFQLGPDQGASKLAAQKPKMKLDLVLALRALGGLPTPWKRLLRLLESAGWPPTEETWVNVARDLQNQGILLTSLNHITGGIFDVWLVA